jgi:gliding motility-associated-like protein
LDTVTTAIHKTILLTATGSDAAQTATLNWTPYVGFANVRDYEAYQQLEAAAFTPLRDVPVVAANVNQIVSKTGGDAFNQAYRIKTTDATSGEVSFSNITKLSFKNGLVYWNVVTSNGDGNNDYLTFDNLKLYPENSIKIYNRWGRLVYSTDNYKGDYVPDEAGTYMYLFTAGGNSNKGWFEVVK